MSKPVLDLERDFAEVVGDPRAKYMQDFHFFNARGEYVGDAPEEHKRGAAKKPLSAEARKAQELIEQARARAAAEDEEKSRLAQAGAKLEAKIAAARGRAQPDAVVDAAKENAQALKAELTSAE